MKPMMFKDQASLTSFLQRLPVVEGSAKIQNQDVECSEIVDRCVALVPRIFEYKTVLITGPGGVGTNNALTRFADVAMDNVLEEKIQAYNQAIEAINQEVTTLIEMGGGDTLAESLKRVRSQVAYFTLIKQTIEGFRDKFNKLMKRVEERYAELSVELNKNKRKLALTLELEQVNTLIATTNERQANVKELMVAMDEYCALQIGYSALMLGSRK